MNDSSKKNPKRNINWEEVEYKVSIICRKFNNIDARFKDDLAQELRIHAYYYSDDYYDLQRKAIDFWRTLTRRVYPEIPFLDLEIVGGPDKDCFDKIVYEDTLKTIRAELTKDVYDKASDLRINKLALEILDIITDDIDGGIKGTEVDNIPLHKYRNGKINLSYLDFMFPDINYKSISKAMNHLRKVIEDLKKMGKI